MRNRRVVNIRLVCVLSAMMLWGVWGGSAGAEDYDFWVQTPTHWQNRTESLGNDLKKQVMSPQGDAFIEVYAARADATMGVTALADEMENRLKANGVAYVQNRTGSRPVEADGQPAVLREYQGNYNGIPLRSYAMYAFGNGGGFMIVGVFVDSQAAKYRDTVYACVTSLRFSPPGAPKPGPVAADPYAGAGPAVDCNAIVGKWQWFTGSTAEFGPDGAIPGQGNRWECSGNREYRIYWENGKYVDTLTLSADSLGLEGKNQYGRKVWGKRIGNPAPKPETTKPQTTAPGTPEQQAVQSGVEKISGNMSVQWGFAHGSVKPDSPCEWMLQAKGPVTLTFENPYGPTAQVFQVTAVNTATGQETGRAEVRSSGSLSLGQGAYRIKISTGGAFAGWRCQWQ